MSKFDLKHDIEVLKYLNVFFFFFFSVCLDFMEKPTHNFP